MYKKLILLIFGIILINFISAVPPFVPTENINVGLAVEPTFNKYLRTGENYTFEMHVFNVSDGYPITSDITCYIHLYNETGEHQWTDEDDTTSDMFDYEFDVDGGNFTRGHYRIKYQCNHSAQANFQYGGGIEYYFNVNDYGLELTEAEQNLFNQGMIILFVFLIATIFGCFKVENYIGKFTLYWTSHILVILITFSAWQFTEGYAIGYIGIAGIYRILFMVSTLAVIPMMILSGAWIFYIHAFNEHFQRLLDKGEDPETAFSMAKKKRNGWFGGQGGKV